MESFNDYSICQHCGNFIYRLMVENFTTWVAEDPELSDVHMPTLPDEYRSHKFGDDIRAEILWTLSLDTQQDDTLGEAETFGWYALFGEFNAILMTDCAGNVGVTVFDSYDECALEWSDIEDHYDEWIDSATDWREADRTEDDYDDYAWDYRY